MQSKKKSLFCLLVYWLRCPASMCFHSGLGYCNLQKSSIQLEKCSVSEKSLVFVLFVKLTFMNGALNQFFLLFFFLILNSFLVGNHICATIQIQSSYEKTFGLFVWWFHLE